jgi:hypothetical protein
LYRLFLRRIRRHRRHRLTYTSIQHTLAVFYLNHTTKPKRYVRNIILRRNSINPTLICWYGRSRGRMQWAGLRLRPYLSTYIISVYTPVSLWKEKKSSIVARCVRTTLYDANKHAGPRCSWCHRIEQKFPSNNNYYYPSTVYITAKVAGRGE